MRAALTAASWRAGDLGEAENNWNRVEDPRCPLASSLLCSAYTMSALQAKQHRQEMEAICFQVQQVCSDLQVWGLKMAGEVAKVAATDSS